MRRIHHSLSSRT